MEPTLHNNMERIRASVSAEGEDGRATFQVSNDGVRIILQTEDSLTASVLISFVALRELRVLLERMSGKVPHYYVPSKDV